MAELIWGSFIELVKISFKMLVLCCSNQTPVFHGGALLVNKNHPVTSEKPFLLRILPFSGCFWGAEQLQELLGAQNVMNHQGTEALGSLRGDSLSHNALVTLVQPSPQPRCAPPAPVWVPSWPRAHHPQLLLPCQDNLITNPVSRCF